MLLTELFSGHSSNLRLPYLPVSDVYVQPLSKAQHRRLRRCVSGETGGVYSLHALRQAVLTLQLRLLNRLLAEKTDHL